MFGIGWSEWLVIGVVLLLVFGPKQLPTIARQWARTLNTLKHEFKNFLD